MLCVKLQSMEELDCLKDFFTKRCPDVKWAYRGQNNSEWSLRPTIERIKWDSTNSNVENVIKKVEICMIRRFKELLGIGRNDIGCSDDFGFCNDDVFVSYLAVMQHYEIPTRLLDFSWSIYVALYFASVHQAVEDHGKDRAIWAIRLNPIEKWTKPYKGVFRRNTGCTAEQLPLLFADDILQNAKKRTALKHRVFPLVIEKNNPRMMAQRGLFIMSIYPGRFMLDLGVTLGSEFNAYGDAKHAKRLSVCEIQKMLPEEVAVLKVEYPDSMNGAVINMLNDKNITYETMFPEMECIKCKIKRDFCCR